MSRQQHRHQRGPQQDAKFELVPAPDLAGEPDGEALRAALSELFEALNALPDPMSSVVDELAPNDIVTLMRPMPIPARGSTLRHLGMARMAPPKKIPQALCRSIVDRMRSASYHDRWYTAWMLTAQMRTLLWGAVALAEIGPPSHDPLRSEKVEKFLTQTPDHQLRLAFWSEVRASVDDARLIRWASQQPWWLAPSLAEEHGRQLARLAQAVIDASPLAALTADPEARDAARDGSGTAHEHAAPVGTDALDSTDTTDSPDHEVETDEGNGTPVPAGGAVAVNGSVTILHGDTLATDADDPGEPGADATGDPDNAVADGGGAVGPDKGDGKWVAQARALLVDAHAGAGLALPRISVAVEAFAVPDPQDIAAVSSYADAARALFGQLAARTGSPPVADLAAFDAALEQLERDSQSRQVARLLTLRAAVTNLHLDSALATVHQLAEQPDAPREALLALADLVDLVTSVSGVTDYAAVSSLQQAMAPLGADSPVLSTAALMGQLTFADPDPTPGPVTADSEDRALSDTDIGEPGRTDPSQAAASLGSDGIRETPTTPQQPAASSATAAPEEAFAEAPNAGASTVNTPGHPGEPIELAPQTAPSALPATTTETPVARHAADDVNAAAEQPEGLDEPAVTDAQVEAVLADLVGSGRLALAAALAQKGGKTPDRVAALQLAALAEQVRTDASPALTRVLAIVAEADDLGSEEVALTVAVPALLRVALVTGDQTCGALLTNLAGRLDDELATVAQRVGERALRGSLFGNTLSSAVADLSDLDAAIAAASEAAQVALSRPRTIRGFKRASDIAARWMSRDGQFGTLLAAAAADDRGRAAFVAEQVRRLSGHAAAARMVEDADRELRGSGTNRIDGAAKQDLVELAGLACDIASCWLEAVAVRGSAVQLIDPRTTAEVVALRSELQAHAAGALAALEAKAAGARPVAAAAARHASTQLRGVFALLQAPTPPAAEIGPEAVLTMELLKLPGAVANPGTGVVTVEGEPDLRALMAAARMSWSEAFTDKLEGEDYVAARVMLERAGSGTLPGQLDLGPNADERLERAVTRSRSELDALHQEVSAQVRQAQMNGLLSAEQDLELSDTLRPVTLDGDGLGAARTALNKVAGMLPAFRSAAADRLTARLDSLASHGEAHPDADRIVELIGGGELSTAEELIYALETGEAIPEQQTRPQLPAFFPAVPDALPHGITAEVIDIVREGRSLPACKGLSYSGLSPEARVVVSTTLERWRTAAQLNAEGRRRMDHAAWLAPVLRLAGYDVPVAGVKSTADRSTEWRTFEVSNVRTTGKAMLPDFGSRLNGRLRVLVCWQKPDPNLLMSWVDQDAAAQSVLVVYFGTMSADLRQRLAVRVLSSSAPVVVLDDAALAYLAAYGNRQLADAMAVLAPFAAIRPYAREKRSLVPPELFYGRDSERRDVMSMTGPQIVYGGRGLGKSALLRDAKARFEQGGVRKGVYLDLKTTEIGPRRLPAETLWPVLWQGLRDAGIAPAPRPKSGEQAVGYQEVRTCIREWLLEDTGRQLLILLDESDDFFEADASHFTQTTRLKDLGSLPDAEGRAKAVFAGLHSVQRFAAVSNQVFKHLAQQPIVIGPLPPQYAYNLLTRPLETLGYEFERDDLVFRICGYCSYQPFLLQMFATRLLEQMHTKRETDGLGAGEPPYVIRSADVDAVEDRADLKVDIQGTFADTLNLDPRYYVIANVLAHHAHQQTLDARLPERELRADCLSWWPEGFTMLDVERFRTYLTEMVGLGVLAQNTDGRGWHLRSPNTLRMMGTAEQVENNLLNAREKQVEPEYLALNARRKLARGGTAPLTAEQIADVLGDRGNQVRVVLGTDATGLAGVSSLLTEVTQDVADHYKLTQVTDRSHFRAALTDGVPGRRRGVLSDLAAAGTKCDGCAEAFRAASTLIPTTPGVTRSVVLVAGPGQIPFWKQVLTGGDADGQVVTLRRLDAKALKAWTLESDRPFNSEALQDRLMEVTSGWPILLDRARALVASGQNPAAALEALLRQLVDPAGAATFLSDAGLGEDRDLTAALDAVIRYTEGAAMPQPDLVDVIADSPGPDGTDPQVALACLDALGVFDKVSDGWQVDALLLACWPHRDRAFAS